MKVSEIKIGSVLELEEGVFYVNEYQYVSNGTNTVVLTKLKNIETEEEKEMVLNSEDEVTLVTLTEKEALYSYSDDSFAYFTDNESKETYKTSKTLVESLSGGYEVDVPYRLQFCKDKLVKIIPPSYLTKLITEE